MSFVSMWSELTGSIPKLAPDYAKTIINRAWRDVRRQSLWSFLLAEGNWTSPALINTGTVTVTQGATTVVFNAAAAAAINAVALGPPTPIAQRQFRIGVGTIYNITAWDNPTLTATLDRAYQESTAAAVAYMIYQCYYPAPVEDFWSWLSIRDMVNSNDLIYTKTRAWVDEQDPQRQRFYIPTHVVGYQPDQNAASSTYRWMQFELWGQPQYQLTYQLYYLRKGTDLVNPTDTLPPAIGEDCVMALARASAYEWAAANLGDIAREQASDYRFLIQNAKTDYGRLFKEYRKQDRAAVDNFFTRCRRTWASGLSPYGWYSSVSGSASAGAAW